MTDLHATLPDDDADVLAAEYVLGVLALVDRLAVEARIRSDADFAARILRWETHFEALNDEFQSEPAPDLMPQIEARLFGKQQPRKRNWWGRIVGAGVAAALAIAVLAVLPPGGSPGSELTASLAADAQDLAFTASYSEGVLTVERTSGSGAASGRAYELWLIVGDAAPVSLGLIRDAISTHAREGLAPGAILAVSDEPTGGSTTGAPTGAVLVTGVVTTI